MKTVRRSWKAGVPKHGLAGYWSRRINEENRMVCKVKNDALLIA
ncbi:type II toxin-antitoxin system YoeB family toxin [Marinobacter sp. X15-166B]